MTTLRHYFGSAFSFFGLYLNDEVILGSPFLLFRYLISEQFSKVEFDRSDNDETVEALK